MPLQLGRNPKSYPPNNAYRDNWDRMFGKGKKSAKEASGAKVIEHLTRATRERYCDEKPTRLPDPALSELIGKMRDQGQKP